MIGDRQRYEVAIANIRTRTDDHGILTDAARRPDGLAGKARASRFLRKKFGLGVKSCLLPNHAPLTAATQRHRSAAGSRTWKSAPCA